MKLGTENRTKSILAAALGAVALLTAVYEFMPTSSTIASTGGNTTMAPLNLPDHPTGRKLTGAASGKKARPPQSLDPMLHLQQLDATEQIKYEGSGRNIFVSQAEVVDIPKPLANGAAGPNAVAAPVWTPPPVAAPPPIPLKFFGFANQPGERKRVFLSKGEDVFIAGEGEIVDRRYKVVRISASSVEIQDVVSSGPPQTVPLTQG